MSNISISAAMINAAAQRTGAKVIDVRRVLLGLAPFDADRLQVVEALVEAGAPRAFLERVALTGRPLIAPNQRTTDNQR
jgi:hypothetical protein